MREKRARAEPHRVRRRQVERRGPTVTANGHVAVPAPGVAGQDQSRHGKVVALATGPSPEAWTTAALEANRCAKCRSAFVMREPAFLHCYYCGAMTRIPSGSLLEQELFELRSGLRLAS